ncbi:uncharacterized protein [Littorina saxatilis]|uniref:Uncharacterized protein n=1 Tax=Littorina saxatilis TaxID=31220 RepID=A0AAN9G1S6_9CAEN
MATGGASTRKDEDFRHTCGLCMEPYRGRTPKILPCFHTFCLPCLTTLEASVTIATPGNPPEDDGRQPEGEEQQSETNRDDNEKKTPETPDSKEESDDVTFSSNDVSTSGQEPRKAVLLCPMCRAPVPVPEGGVAHLQSNFYVDHEKSVDEAPPPVLCDMCDEGNQQHAAHVCHQCSLRMCRECRRCHDKCTRNHHVTSLSLGEPSIARIEKKGVCLVHLDQTLCFHCQQCDVSICLHCKLTSHEGHATLDLAIAAAQARKEVTSLVTSAQEQLQVMESSLLRVECDEQKLTRHKQDVTQQIHARYDVIMASIQRSRDELLDEVSAKEERPRSQLRAQKTAATVTKETLSALVSRAARVSDSDPDVVRVRKELQAALLSEDRLDQHRQQADRQQCMWSWRYDVTDVSLVQQDVVGACMGRVVEGGDDDVTRPLSVTQLADKLDRLVTRLESTEADVTTLKNNEAHLEKNVTALSGDFTALKNREIDMKTDSSALSYEVTALKKTTTALEDDVTAIKTTTSALEGKVAMVGKTTVFNAMFMDEAKTKGDEPIVFSSVKVNEGGCYDDTTGVFTTSVPGTYVFTATVHAGKKDSSVLAYIMVDDNIYAYLHGSYTSNGSSSVSVQLGVGQRVWVKARGDGDGYYSPCMGFTGALVTPQFDSK